MIKKLAVFAFALVAFATIANAQYKTGSSVMDAALKVIDDDATANSTLFKKDVSTTYNVPETKVNTMSESGMKAGDIVMILETSKITKKPVDDVVKVYEANKTKGWGAIAKELGIKPGSAEFKALKDNTDARAKKAKGGKSKAKSK